MKRDGVNKAIKKKKKPRTSNENLSQEAAIELSCGSILYHIWIGGIILISNDDARGMENVSGSLCCGVGLMSREEASPMSKVYLRWHNVILGRHNLVEDS